MTEVHAPCTLTFDDQTLDFIASWFRVLGEPYRLRIVHVLRRGAMTVGELAQSLNGNQSNVSRHLQLLHRAGMIDRKRHGINIVYSLHNSSVTRLCEMVHQNELRKAEIR